MGELYRHLNYVEMETVRFKETESSARYPSASRRWAAASGGSVSQLQIRASSPTLGKGEVGPGPNPEGDSRAGGEGPA